MRRLPRRHEVAALAAGALSAMLRGDARRNAVRAPRRVEASARSNVDVPTLSADAIVARLSLAALLAASRSALLAAALDNALDDALEDALEADACGLHPGWNADSPRPESVALQPACACVRASSLEGVQSGKGAGAASARSGRSARVGDAACWLKGRCVVRAPEGELPAAGDVAHAAARGDVVFRQDHARRLRVRVWHRVEEAEAVTMQRVEGALHIILLEDAPRDVHLNHELLNVTQRAVGARREQRLPLGILDVHLDQLEDPLLASVHQRAQRALLPRALVRRSNVARNCLLAAHAPREAKLKRLGHGGITRAERYGGKRHVARVVQWR
eukprot:5401984-Pleurochrysis_carterae.AAC.1